MRIYKQVLLCGGYIVLLSLVLYIGLQYNRGQAELRSCTKSATECVDNFAACRAAIDAAQTAQVQRIFGARRYLRDTDNERQYERLYQQSRQAIDNVSNWRDEPIPDGVCDTIRAAHDLCTRAAAEGGD